MYCKYAESMKRPEKAGIKWNAPAMYCLTRPETCGKVLYQAWNMDFGGNGRKKKGKKEMGTRRHGAEIERLLM